LGGKIIATISCDPLLKAGLKGANERRKKAGGRKKSRKRRSLRIGPDLKGFSLP